ncbi:MAG: methyltransferase domain-containing protein [Thermoproteota archaeon]|nr:methyltransferase domain-containing protein [Thermoproteota archaeon]
MEYPTRVGKDDSHNDTIISQFSKQAIPFAKMSQHSNQYGLELMLKLSDPKKNDRVLDVACGPGIVGCEFAKMVSKVTGIDLTPAMIEQARTLQKERNVENIDWRIGDVSNLPFDDSSFSLVVTRYSLHHMIEPKTVLKEMKRVCIPGGRVLVIDVTPEEDKSDAYNHVERLRDPSHTNALTFNELKRIMEDTGLVDIRTEHHDLEMELEHILHSSFPNSQDKDRIKQLFKEDIIRNNLGMRSHLRGDQIFFYFPISMILGFKT